MTMTESPPAAVAEPSAPAPSAAMGLYDWLSTSDHKRIGRMWIHVSVLLFLAAAVVGVALGVERVDAEAINVFGGENSYFQMWGLYRFALVLFVAAPLFIGLATAVVPMQVGSPNIAFPRAALAAAWGYALGAGITIVAVLAGGGWGAIDGVTSEEADAIALTLLGTGMVIVSILLAAICIATTVVSLRTEGMSLLRVPVFAWSMLVACSVWLLTLPVAIANLALAYVDLQHGGPGIFGQPEGPEIYAQLSWIVEQPQIYAIAIPVLGVIGAVVPVAAGSRQANHGLFVALIGLFGLFSIGGWSQPFFHDNTEQFVYIAFGLVIVLPVLGVLFGAVATLAGGKSPFGIPSVHLLGTLGAGLLLLGAVAGGAFRVVEPYELGGTTAATGVLNLAVIAAVTAALAGLWFWAPRIGGVLLSGGLGRLAILLLVPGAVLLGISDVIAGFFDASDLLLAPASEDIVDVVVVLSAVGGGIVAGGALAAFAGMAAGHRGTAAAGDPWEGHTLEWASEVPALVASEAPLLDVADDAAEGDDTEGEDA